MPHDRYRGTKTRVQSSDPNPTVIKTKRQRLSHVLSANGQNIIEVRYSPGQSNDPYVCASTQTFMNQSLSKKSTGLSREMVTFFYRSVRNSRIP